MCGAVHQRFGLVLQQGIVVLAPLFTYQHFGIPCRIGNESQYLACLRLYGYGAAYFTGQQYSASICYRMSNVV